MKIDASGIDFQTLNQRIKSSEEKEVIIDNCIGQRFIGSGLSDKYIEINGVPGNALGCYLDNSVIRVNGNSQDATGDTMNQGRIYIHGSAGDATGYGMRGGKIMIEGNTGYRAGIHMKAYQDNIPVLVIGGVAGSFLGEYQAGGTIVILNLYQTNLPIAGNFCATGIHGGKIFLRTDEPGLRLPKQVISKKATAEDLQEIIPHVEEFCKEFGCNLDNVMNHTFYVLTPNTKNPYKQLYNYN
ncbi:MAG: glutamate synthase [Anaerofustis sp.]